MLLIFGVMLEKLINKKNELFKIKVFPMKLIQLLESQPWFEMKKEFEIKISENWLIEFIQGFPPFDISVTTLIELSEKEQLKIFIGNIESIYKQFPIKVE